MKTLTIDGNEASSMSAYMFTELAGVYPITPSSPMAEHIDEWKQKRKNVFDENVKVIEMQSEAGVAGFIHGSLQAGCLTTTFTSSQGLLLMLPNMYKIAGEMLPCVIHVAARSLATHALSIFGDHQDIYATRATGFSILMSSSVQDANLLSAVAHLSSIESSMPFIHAFDGFRTSHEINKINTLELDEIKKIVNYEKIESFRKRALNPLNPIVKGTTQNDDIYFQIAEAKNKTYLSIPNIVNDYMKKINEIANTDYKPFNYYGNKEAKKIIIAMGSVCETIKEFIDENKEYGLVEVHLYRPFSKEYLIKEIPSTVSNIAVLDRTKESGSVGEPLYLDVLSALSNLKDKHFNIVGGRYGLSSKNTTPAQIKAIYDMLDNPINNFTVGIEDDVTNLSLKIDNNYKITTSDEILIYGYGSDGMVSASKSIIKLIGENTDKYVQGYFQYDSKKSGGVTLSHLRFSTQKIKSTYYVENPKLIVVTKDTYLNDFDVINKIQNNGIFILNTSKTEEEVNEFITENIKKTLCEKNIKLYIINAYDLAQKSGLRNKISTIMESSILKLLNIVDYQKLEEKIIKNIREKFWDKGEEIVSNNIEAIKKVDLYLKQINYDNNYKEINKKSQTIFDLIKERKGDTIPVSKFMDIMDGSFECGTSKLEKRKTSEFVPSWINSNCIECNQCSFVCPHSVIRPFILNEKEYNDSPEYIKEKCKKMLGKENMYFILGISIKDCTGCGLCIKTCPSKEKALISKNIDIELRNNVQEIYDYLDKNITYKPIFNKYTVKGSQFKQSKFCFPGACAGCGETAYIKILTQLFGENLIIANATGCSSIYGGSIPSIPYSLPWMNSLFEDNAEFGLGMFLGVKAQRETLAEDLKAVLGNLEGEAKEAAEDWIANLYNGEGTRARAERLENALKAVNCDCVASILERKDLFVKPSQWIFGGDGWAYDIGYGGVDHVLASGEDVNIFVFDTEVYSNTGGQSSKATPAAAIAKFAASGKRTKKKDLGMMAMSYGYVYVAQVNMGADKNQVLKAIAEAESYQGPSLIIGYAPCINHGIRIGMGNSQLEAKRASECGYWAMYRYNPTLVGTEKNPFVLDSKEPTADFKEFLMGEVRYASLAKAFPEAADALFEKTHKDAMDRLAGYKKLAGK